MVKSVKQVEDIIWQCFRSVPFHNLNYLLGSKSRVCLGGTCTDKSLHFISELKKAGGQSFLHTGKLKKLYDHRVVAVDVEGDRFYANVGGGWPSIKLFPSNGTQEYYAYGIKFQSEADRRFVRITHSVEGVQGWPLKVPQKLRCREAEVVKTRDRYDKVLPFSQGVRFAQVLGDQFIFLKDTTVRIYGGNGVIQVVELLPDEIISYIEDVLFFSLGDLRDGLKQLLEAKYG